MWITNPSQNLSDPGISCLTVTNGPPGRAPGGRRLMMGPGHGRRFNGRAMNILRSPGLATDPPEVILQQLLDLHPQEAEPSQMRQPSFSLSSRDFQFIDAEWVKKQILRNKRSTAVDQWGWDSREIWRDIINDDVLMNLVAKHWILPIAAGYLPVTYKDHLAGGRLVALSKHPEPDQRHRHMAPHYCKRITSEMLG